jgi:hypothetical protein
MTEDERRRTVGDAALEVWAERSTAEDQLALLVELYAICFTTIGEPRHLPHPDWFHAEVVKCWRDASENRWPGPDEPCISFGVEIADP